MVTFGPVGEATPAGRRVWITRLSALVAVCGGLAVYAVFAHVQYQFARLAFRQVAAEDYPTVEGRLDLCWVWVSPNGRKADVAVRYTYAVAGREYTGEQARYGDSPDGRDRPQWSGGTGRRFAAAHQQGQPVTVYYNPDDPADALLAPGLSGDYWRVALGLMFANLPLVMLAYGGAGVALRRLRPGGGWQDPLFFSCVAVVAAYLVSYIVADAIDRDVSVRAVCAIVIVTLSAGAVAPVIVWWVAARSGGCALSDRGRILSLPGSPGGPSSVQFDDVLSIDLAEGPPRGRLPLRRTYAPLVRWRDSDGTVKEATFGRWDQNRYRAEKRVLWLQERVFGSGQAS